MYKNHICSSLNKTYNTQGEEGISEIKNDANEGKSSNEKGTNEDLKDFLSEFECPVCFEVMASPKRIYACSKNHFICSLCLFDTKLSACPSCRENFNVTKPLIQHTCERIVERLLQKKLK